MKAPFNPAAAERAAMPAAELTAEVARRIGPAAAGPVTKERRDLIQETVLAVLYERYQREWSLERDLVAYRAKARGWFRDQEARRAV